MFLWLSARPYHRSLKRSRRSNGRTGVTINENTYDTLSPAAIDRGPEKATAVPFANAVMPPCLLLLQDSGGSGEVPVGSKTAMFSCCYPERGKTVFSYWQLERRTAVEG